MYEFYRDRIPELKRTGILKAIAEHNLERDRIDPC